MALEFARAGFGFIKFNFSHNGGTPQNPIDFPDLEAFGHNNYSKELDDLGAVIDWSESQFKKNPHINTDEIVLMGHSRGGGIIILKAAEDRRIKRIISLAGVSDFKARFPKGKAFEEWQEKGVYCVKNGRTGQEMPHFFQFYKDFIEHEGRLTISIAAKQLRCPFLIIQGTNDDAVKTFEAERLHQWCAHSALFLVQGANHVFGMKQPWEKTVLPKDMNLVIKSCIAFLSETL
jgi:pimeloyl-ACP methyl ester carboxylesterase